jgi:hypothetical protein
MNAADLLTTLAQLGVAMAGFSGIVVVLGARATGQWSSRERELLSILLGASGAVVLWSILPLLLLAADLSERRVWLLSSGSWCINQGAVLVVRARGLARDREAQTQERSLVIFAFLGAIIALAMQLANVIWLGVAWPHLAAVAWQLALSFLVFVRLLRPPPT